MSTSNNTTMSIEQPPNPLFEGENWGIKIKTPLRSQGVPFLLENGYTEVEYLTTLDNSQERLKKNNRKIRC